MASLCITAVLGCINYMKKKKKKKWFHPIVHYPVSPALSLVWYWMRMEKPRAGSADTYDTKQLLVERES